MHQAATVIDAAWAAEADAEGLVSGLLRFLGENPDRQGLQGTPDRVVRSLRFLTSGYEQSLDEVVRGALFDEECSEMVAVTRIEFFSLCEHHLLPFHGQAHVAYIPHGRVIGLSKLPRIVDLYARRLQVQERLTEQIADAVVEVLAPHGVAVMLEASHLCMMMRGVQKQDSRTVTAGMRGRFIGDERLRREFLELVRR